MVQWPSPLSRPCRRPVSFAVLGCCYRCGVVDRRFHVIDGTPPPETPVTASRRRMKATAKPDEMLDCPRCSGREFIETKTGILLRNGKPTGGTKALICVACLTNGERVLIL